MNPPILAVLAIIAACDGFLNPYPKIKSIPISANEDVGDALFLTPLIENGKIDQARKLATVQHKEMTDVSSYAGYFTVNKEYNSNLFLWFFPSQINPKSAPVVLWLQGGPGSTSLYGLFTENGPFSVTANMTLKARKYSWNLNHNLIFIDNPVGTGYSFTDNDLGYAVNETDVGRDVRIALTQFFNLFPELQQNEFYVTGESYAGKYVPAVSYAIKEFNTKSKTKINLKGLAMGNGLSDPVNQLRYSDYLYQIGLLDFNGRDQFKKLEDQAIEFINQEKHKEAFEIFDKLIDNDLSDEPSLFTNLTGFKFYYNYLHTHGDTLHSGSFADFVQKADVRKAIHVGNYTFHSDNKVEVHLREDITKSVKSLVSDLLDHYRVLIYNGQLDIIVAYPLTENYLINLDWSGAKDYKTATRKLWLVGKEIAGYSKTVRNLTEILVRNAGHMVPADQPQWAWDMITRFTHHKPF